MKFQNLKFQISDFQMLCRRLDRWEDAHPSLSAWLGAALTLGAIVTWTLALFMIGE